MIEQEPWPGYSQPPQRGLDLKRAGSLASRDAEAQIHGPKKRTCTTARCSRQGLHDRRALDAKVRFEGDADQAENRSLMFRVKMRRLVYLAHPAQRSGLTVAGCGSEMGAAIRRQSPLDAVRCRDRSPIQSL